MRPGSPAGTAHLLMRTAVVMAVVVAVDLLVKQLVTAALGPDADRHAWWLAGEWLGFEYVRNTGAAFGLFRGNPELLAALALIFTAGIVWLVLTEVRSPAWAALASGLLAGGSIGNFAERVTIGYVTDFIAVGPWPRFNVADSAITVGIAVFVAAILFEREDMAEEQHTDDRPA